MLICSHLTLGFLQVSTGERIIGGGLTSRAAPLGRGKEIGEWVPVKMKLKTRPGAARSTALAPEVAGRGGSLWLTDGLLVPTPSIGPGGS